MKADEPLVDHKAIHVILSLTLYNKLIEVQKERKHEQGYKTGLTGLIREAINDLWLKECTEF